MLTAAISFLTSSSAMIMAMSRAVMPVTAYDVNGALKGTRIK
jgi:hypothetical protein